jgi:hypothetical protein
LAILSGRHPKDAREVTAETALIEEPMVVRHARQRHVGVQLGLGPVQPSLELVRVGRQAELPFEAVDEQPAHLVPSLESKPMASNQRSRFGSRTMIARPGIVVLYEIAALARRIIALAFRRSLPGNPLEVTSEECMGDNYTACADRPGATPPETLL